MKYAGVIAGLLCIILTGCGTLLTINSGTSYGGVQADAGGIKNVFAQTPTEIMPHWAEGFLSLVDLPLSAITDTLALPYTIFKGRRAAHPLIIERLPKGYKLDSKANYIQRGYDPKKAEQCAKEDFISATGRTPNPSF